MASPRFSLASSDFQKIFIGLVVAMIGAGVTFITDKIPGWDFGQWTPVVAAGWATVANLIRKWLTDTSGGVA